MEDLQWWPDGDDAEVWVWYVFMVVFCAFGNLWHLASTWRSVGHPSDAYGTAMKWLAVPWVVNCAWRSVFPSLYMERFAFWNTPLNSILLGRTFAFVGELSWVFQTCLAMRHVDKEVTKKSTCWVQLSAWSAFGVYVVAEAVSYYNTATENQYWGAVEVTLRLSHAASFSIPLPILAPPLSPLPAAPPASPFPEKCAHFENRWSWMASRFCCLHPPRSTSRTSAPGSSRSRPPRSTLASCASLALSTLSTTL